MKVLSTLGVKGVFDELVPRFEREAGISLDLSLDPTAVLLRRIVAGERADLAVLTSAGVEQLIGEGVMRSGTRVDLARSKVGMAVKAGTPKPDISTAAAVKTTLLAADRVAYSRAGASGIFFKKVLEQLGIAEAVDAKAVVIPAGFTGELVADGRASIAIQQMSELMAVAGIDIVGPLPPEIQDDLVFSSGIFADAANAAAASAFQRYISAPATEALYRAKGLYAI